MTLGKCHLCLGTKGVTYCELCDHWFCEDCKTRWFWRGLEAVKQLTQGRRPGCCGPK